MGGGDDVQAPQMSAEERRLLQLQGTAAQRGLNILTEQEELQNALLPTMFEAAGLEPVFRTQESVNEEIAGLERRLETLQGQRFTTVPVSTGGGFIGSMRLPAQTGVRRFENEAVTREIRSLQNQIRTLQREGTQQIMSFNRIEDPDQAARDEIERGFLERTKAALAGELPVNPALLTDLERQQAEFENMLRSRLGTGFETTTAGTQALDEFRRFKTDTLENARRQDLITATELGMAQGGFNESLTDTFLSRLGAVGSFRNPLIGATQSVASSFASPASQFAAQRNLEFQAAVENSRNSGSGIFGSILGGVAGSFLGPIGAAVGTQVGSIFEKEVT